MDTATDKACGEVSYALVPYAVIFDPDGPDGPAAPIVQATPALLGVSSPVVAAAGNPFDPSRSPLLPPGGTFTYARRLVVGDRNDVASVSDGVYTALYTVPEAPAPVVGVVTGDVDAEDVADVPASLLFEGKLSPFFGDNPLPMTEARTDATGKYSVVLPPGAYKVTVRSPERADLVQTIAVAPFTSATFSPKLGRTGSVIISVTEKGRPVPARLTFVGVEGTKSPDFSRFSDAFVRLPATGQAVADLAPGSYTRSPAMDSIFTSDGLGTQIVKPGKYQVIASRGLEYSIARKTITVTAGQTTAVDLPISRVVDTTGFVSADFHVHSGRSFDSSTPLLDRVKSYAAEGVEVLVSTDHNYILDYAPVITKLGLGSRIKSIVGNELTTSLPNPAYPQAFGHHNAFPLLVDPLLPKHGAPFTEYMSAATFYDRTRATNPGVDKIIQLNHPRAGVAGLTLIGLFNTVGFSPTKPLGGAMLGPSFLGTGTRNIDFDALEIFNGPSIGEYQQVRNDWFSLINQGYYKTGTAVSDSHRIVLEDAGYPRSYVATETDDPAALTDDMVVQAVKAGNVSGTSGPFIRFDLDGAPMGSLVSKRSGALTATIVVQAPAWVPIDEVRILGNGKLVKLFDGTTFPLVRPQPVDPTSTEGVIRFHGVVKLNPSVDTYYVVEAGTRLPAAVDTDGDGVIDTGDANGDGRIDATDKGLAQPPSPPIYAAIAKGTVPLAFTNPIFVDRNGNGKFDAPGVEALIVPTSKAPFATATDRVETSDENAFPWHGLKIGKKEFDLFVSRLSAEERELATCLR